MDEYEKYQKPSWAPPASVFGPVWTVLYVIIAVSFSVVFINVGAGRWPFLIALPFILNLVFNFLYTPVQFYWKNLTIATVIIVLVLATLVWATIGVMKFSSAVAIAQIPYLLWVSFATVLQLSIRRAN